MDFCKVPRELRNRVREYYEVKYQGKMFNENSILDELNPLLREKVINFNCRSLVKSVEFLAAADPDFVSDLIASLNVEVYLQGDKIIEEGRIGNQMYFIRYKRILIKKIGRIPHNIIFFTLHRYFLCFIFPKRKISI